MKNKILKTILVISLIIVLAMMNFIVLGINIRTYAAEIGATNEENVKFDAYFKTSNNTKVTTLDTIYNNEELYMYLQVEVEKEGYLNSTVTIDGDKFIFEDSDSQYVKSLSDESITLHQLNAGSSIEIKVKIKPIKDEYYDINLLTSETEVSINGTYRDSQEKDINVTSTKNVKLNITDGDLTEILDLHYVVTNKHITINGEDKTIVQFAMGLGLEKNDYPTKKIDVNIQFPEINNQYPTVAKENQIIDFNNMTSQQWSYSSGLFDLTMENATREDGSVTWKTESYDGITLTAIYDGKHTITNEDIEIGQIVSLYNNRVLTLNTTETIDSEKDSIVVAINESKESSIYKGEIYNNIDRILESTTYIAVNYHDIVDRIQLLEDETYLVNDTTSQEANVYYSKSILNRANLVEMFGEEFLIEIGNTSANFIQTIDENTETDVDGNIQIIYPTETVESISIITSDPISNGDFIIEHTKVMTEANEVMEKAATALRTELNYIYNYGLAENVGDVEVSYSEITLNETVTKAQANIDKTSLSTIVDNEIEMQIDLLTNNTKYDLYKNPVITITVPSQVTEIDVTNINLVNGEGLSIKDYSVNGKQIIITLQGEQIEYSEETILGPKLNLEMTLGVNQLSGTSDESILVEYTNEKVNKYENGDAGAVELLIKITAPTDVTTINEIQSLNIQNIGEGDTVTAIVPKGTTAKEHIVSMQLINNNSNTIEDVKILGTFPTDSSINNMGVIISELVNITGATATVYYTENEKATDDISNDTNGWKTATSSNQSIKKYLIVIDEVAARTTVTATYKITIPANLEYNQIATMDYTTSYVNSLTGIESTKQSTPIKLDSGVGPIVETELTTTMNNKDITESVKTGEVVQYTIKVENTGTEIANDVKVTGKVPTGTVLVMPNADYVYSGETYYDELTTTTLTETITELKPGEVKYFDYEVRIKETTTGAKISNTATIEYGEVVKTTNSTEITVEQGDLQVEIKRITDVSTIWEEGQIISYFVMVKNTSTQTLNDVVVEPKLDEYLEIVTMEIVSDRDREIGKNEYQSINIGSIAAGEIIILEFAAEANNLPDNITTGTLYADVIANSKDYSSNLWIENIVTNNIELNMTASREQIVKENETLNYIVTVENLNNTSIDGMRVISNISDELRIDKVLVDGIEVDNRLINGEITIIVSLDAYETATIEIQTTAVLDYYRVEDETINAKTRVELNSDIIAETQTLTHVIQIEETEDPDAPKDPGDGSGNVAIGEQVISGTAWLDENSDGKKDSNEETLSGVKVKLLNVKTNSYMEKIDGTELIATTNEDGIYLFYNIPVGEYIAVYEFDTQYGLTKYKATGLIESENSNVTLNTIKVGNESITVPATDVIIITDNDVTNVNIGLIILKNFDLELNKYVSKIITQNVNGTKQTEYNNASIAKLDLDATEIEGTTAIIEYKIVITNNGEIEGYAKKIQDNIPADLKFSSELNPTWYQTSEGLYNTSLENEVIKPGESKEITLVLTKTMTESNTGLINNTAEIVEAYNEFGIEDSNSTPGNKEQSENDFGSADAIISVRTGGGIYVAIVLGIIGTIAIIAAAVILIKKKVLIK